MDRTRTIAAFLILLLLLALALCACSANTSAPTPLPEPAAPAAEAPPIATAEPAGAEVSEPAIVEFVAGENDIIINPGSEWELEGILTLPEGEGPFPAVIIVPHSGPASKDEYRDLTAILAKQGLAGIRYDNRMFTYIEIEKDINSTLKEEYIDDALSTVAYAKTIKNIDPEMIFVLGHSIGGFLIPKIHEADEENAIAGFVSLAGSALPMIEQYVLGDVEIDPSIDSEISEEWREVENKVRLKAYEDVKNLTEADRRKRLVLLGQFPAWWLYLADYDPAESAKKIDKPILFMQGSHDEVFLPNHMDMWKKATQNNPKAAYKIYPGLDHFFIKTEKLGGKRIGSSIEEEVVIDIADFIKSQY